MDFFLLLIFDPEPEEVWYACDNNDKIFLILIKRRRIKSIEILLIQKGEIFVIVLSTGATERYNEPLYPFLDYMRPKTRNDKKKKITILEYQESKRKILLFQFISNKTAGVIIILKNKIEFVVESNFGIKDK
ncbi:hypothetical protein ACJX0J_003909 [Zea mays]